jgi:DNA-binding IclR family transcriptional regulator
VGAELTAEAAERGLRVSIFGSTTGAAYLSTLPRTEVDRLIARARINEDDALVIFAQTAAVRKAGVADGPSGGGRYWSIALSLPAQLSPAPLILGLAGPAERIKQNLANLHHLMRDMVEHCLSEDDATDHAR